jgi:Mycobacterium membrane protein
MSINPLDDDLRLRQRVEGWVAVVEPGVRDVRVAEAWSDVATADLQDVDQQPGRELTLPRRPRQPSRTPRANQKSHRNRRFTISKVLRRAWIPLLIVVVLGAGGLTVLRLHGIFGSEKRPTYADSQINDAKPFDPKHLTYEVFGPPGTVAKISYFDVNADPKRVEGARLPWSLTFAMTEASAVGSVVAQGDSDAIGCRIVVDGVLKAEKITHETNAFTFCSLKAS